MSARDAVLNRIRASLRATAGDVAREEAVTKRLDKPPKGVVPARGQLEEKARTDLFCTMAEAVAATVERVKKADDVPKAVAAYLRAKNLPSAVRMGDDRRLRRMPWQARRSLEVRLGAADAEDAVGVSHALAGVAETGTLVLASGGDNPTTINFLPEHHIVVVDTKDIAGDLEAVLSRIRRKFGRGEMPRTLNLVTGPSRSADIEQTLLLGAHGPRALHVIVVGG